MDDARNDLDGHAAGHFAAILPAHTIGDHEQALAEIDDEIVFVIGANALSSPASHAQRQFGHVSSSGLRQAANQFHAITHAGIASLYLAFPSFANVIPRRA